VFKSIISLIIIILLVIFASQNMHDTSVHIVMGSPIEVPLILIIAGAFLAGYVTALISFVVAAPAKKHKAKQELPQRYPR